MGPWGSPLDKHWGSPCPFEVPNLQMLEQESFLVPDRCFANPQMSVSVWWKKITEWIHLYNYIIIHIYIYLSIQQDDSIYGGRWLQHACYNLFQLAVSWCLICSSSRLSKLIFVKMSRRKWKFSMVFLHVHDQCCRPPSTWECSSV